jgi:hypothetical protein
MIPEDILAADRQRGHAFIPDDLASLPKLFSTEGTLSNDKIIHLHYFMGSADWWIAEVDPENLLAFGYACLGDPQGAEWGYVDLAELGVVSITTNMREVEPGDDGEMVVKRVVQFPMLVERDLYWNPKPFGEVAR